MKSIKYFLINKFYLQFFYLNCYDNIFLKKKKKKKTIIF